MIPKVVYSLNGVEKTITFDAEDFTEFHPKWERDEVEYKNPFNGDRKWKKRGYYFNGVVSFEGLPYALLDDYKDIWNKTVDDLKFYPNQDTPEYYEVDSNDVFEYDDAHVPNGVLNFEIVFRGKKRFDTPLSYSYDFWGDRLHTFADEAAEVY